MVVLYVVEYAIIFAFFALMVNQFFVPLFQGLPLFWGFTREGRRQKRLQDELARLKCEAASLLLTEKIDAIQKELEESSQRRLQAQLDELESLSNPTSIPHKGVKPSIRPTEPVPVDDTLTRSRVAQKH